MTDEERVGEVLNGKTRIWRFTAEEQGGSSDTADRLLWLGILRAEHELAASLFGGLCEGTGEPSRGTPSPYRFLTELAQPLPGERLRFYNSDYYISDLQPGRNTVIDADSGRVRFIDPRITLNDPDGPHTPVIRFGTRREDMPGQIFD